MKRKRKEASTENSKDKEQKAEADKNQEMSKLEEEIILTREDSEEAIEQPEAETEQEAEFSEFVPESDATGFRAQVLSNEENFGNQDFEQPLESQMQGISTKTEEDDGRVTYNAPNYSVGYEQAKDYSMIESGQNPIARSSGDEPELSQTTTMRREPTILFSGEQRPIDIRDWQRIMDESRAGAGSRQSRGAEEGREYQPREIRERKSRERLPFQQ